MRPANPRLGVADLVSGYRESINTAKARRHSLSSRQDDRVMKVEYSIFAYSAILTPDGLFSLLGGGIEWVTAKSLPAVCRSLVLLVRLSLEPSEWSTTHECVVKVFDPDGNSLPPELVVTVKPTPNKLHPD